MARKLSAVFLLSIYLIAILAASAFGADKPFVRFKDRASFPARFAPVYGFAGSESGAYASPKSSSKMTLGPLATNAIGFQISSTAYDYQHNCSMGRQVEHRGTQYLHFDWMDQPLDYSLPGDRGVGVQSYDLVDCDILLQAGGKRAGGDYEGYVCMDADPGGCAIPIAHGGLDNNQMSPRAYWDFCAGAPLGLFTADYPVDKYGWYLTEGTNGGNQNLWPIGDMQYGTETVLHIITTESGGDIGDPQTLSYYRRVGPYLAGGGSWSAQRLLDTVMNINPVIATSTTTDKVAIVWNAPADYYNDRIDDWTQNQNDIWYVVSTMQGADWIAGISNQRSISYDLDHGFTHAGANITQYDSMSDWKAYCNISALYTTDDELHIIWGCRRWDGDSILYRRRSGIFHWSTKAGADLIRTVVKAEWDTGGECYGHTWGSDVDKGSISECDGRLYVLYTQFGTEDLPCWDIDSANSVINGELFMTVSGNDGLNWDRPQNLTNTPSHECPIGECESDNWATMARYGRLDVAGCNDAVIGTNVLDIEYINDKCAGGAIQTESGIWTLNPVMWFPTPCRPEIEEPAYSDDAGPGYGECGNTDIPLVLQPPSGSVVKSFTMENIGLEDNVFTINVEYGPYGSGWITPNPAGGTIFSGLNNTVDVELTIQVPAGAPDPSVWMADVEIIHDADNSPRILPVCLMVATKFVYPQEAFIATACKELRVYNHGHMSNGADTAALDFNGDCDTLNPNYNAQVYLYSASPVISFIRGSDTVQYSSIFDRGFTEDDAFRPIDSFATIPGSDTMVLIRDAIYSKYYTADSAIGFISEFYSPELALPPGQCEFIIHKMKVWNQTEDTITDLLIAQAFDFDIPTDFDYDTLADFTSGNYSAIDDSLKTVTFWGVEINDSLECGQADAGLRCGGVRLGPNTAFKNMYTLDNPTWVYTTGPYRFEAPLPAGAIYELMLTDTTDIWVDDPDVDTLDDTLYTDLSGLITLWGYTQYVLMPDSFADTLSFLQIYATSRTGPEDLDTAFARAYELIEVNGLQARLMCDLPGDANGDNSVNVGDAVYMINYVFKSGPEPVCGEEGDANHDCALNVGDAVYLINYVFKSGSVPECGMGCKY